MRFSPTILLLFAMQGCGSGLQSANEVDGRSQKQDIDTNVENKSSPATPTAEPVETQEQQAIIAIEKLGGKVTFDKNWVEKSRSIKRVRTGDKKSPDRPVVRVDFRRTKVTDAGLVHLKGLTKLQTLFLDNTKVTDSGLEHLKGLTKLHWLFLNNTKVTDSGLVHLKGLTKLQWLSLDNTKITDDGVKKLQTALPKCKIRH